MTAVCAAVLSVFALPAAASAYPPEPSDESINARSVSVVCQGEVPYIAYEIVTDGFEPSEVSSLTATLRVLDRDGNVVDGPEAGQPLSGRLLYPGAAVDSAGNGTDWPGWKLNDDGLWVPDSLEDNLRAGLRLNAVVNDAETTAAVQYPPESAECLSPPGSSTGTSPQGATRAGQLPSTGGSDPSGLIWIAAATLLAGAAIWGVAFRRNRPVEPTA